VYNNYYGRSYPGSWGGYNDGISPFFWLWMMERNSHSQASYIHNHGSSMDQARLNELYAKNADLQEEVNAMKGQPVNASYVPEGMDKDNWDLMYDDEHVRTVANIDVQPKKSSFGRIVMWTIGLGCLACLIWYFGFNRKY